jgi:hypothetical protein
VWGRDQHKVVGDDFRIIGQVTKAMRRAGIAEQEIETFCDEAMSGHDPGSR